jgi:hypothetical protein
MKPNTHIIRALAIGFALWMAGFARAQTTPPPSPPDAAALLAQADTLFDQASGALSTDPTAARALFAQSAAAYETLIRDHNIRHAAVYTNLGNARLLSGDIGRAIADLRRAERLDPTSETARTGLEAARSRVSAAIAPDTSSRALSILLIWRHVLPRSAVMVIGLCAWAACWIMGAMRIIHGGSPPRAGWIVVSAGVAALCLGGLLLEELAVFRVRDAVVIGENAVGRLGPDAIAFEPSFSAPLSPGVEGRIVADKGEWRMLRLADGRTTWVPAAALDEISPRD